MGDRYALLSTYDVDTTMLKQRDHRWIEAADLPSITTLWKARDNCRLRLATKKQ